MNSTQLSDSIIAFVRSAPDRAAKSDLLLLAEVLRDEKSRSVKKTIEKFLILIPPTKEDPALLSDPAVRWLADFREIVENVGSKTSVDDLNLLETFVRESGAMSLRSLLSVLKPEPLSSGQYVAELKSAAGNAAAFDKVIERMRKDKSLSEEDVIQIANDFTEVAKKRSRTAAFNAIVKKHQYFLEAKQSREAAGSKSAA